jgi:hypothetical protein
MIRLEKGKWVVKSEDGSKTMGTYATRKEAEKRLKQVEMFKHMKGKDSTDDSEEGK